MEQLLDFIIKKDYASFRSAILPSMQKMTDEKIAEREKIYSEQLKNRSELQEAKGFSDKQREYREYFNEMLKKYKIKSPKDLPDEERKKFFDDIDKGWKAKKETD